MFGVVLYPWFAAPAMSDRVRTSTSTSASASASTSTSTVYTNVTQRDRHTPVVLLIGNTPRLGLHRHGMIIRRSKRSSSCACSPLISAHKLTTTAKKTTAMKSYSALTALSRRVLRVPGSAGGLLTVAINCSRVLLRRTWAARGHAAILSSNPDPRVPRQEPYAHSLSFIACGQKQVRPGSMGTAVAAVATRYTGRRVEGRTTVLRPVTSDRPLTQKPIPA